MLFRRKFSSGPETINRIVKPRNKKLRVFLWTLFILVLGVVGWIGATGIIALNNISAKNTDDKPSFFKFGGNTTPDQLANEGDGRINILALGVDNAAGLSDTIQIISIDPINSSLSMLSVPRDLYVTAPKLGKTKINGVYNQSQKKCAKKTSTCDPEIDYGAEALKDVLENTLGVDVHYFARINFEGLKKLVDAVGGVQVYVDKPLSDPKFPNKTNTGYEPLYIPAGMQRMNGDTALKYARSRQTTSDFDRSRRQQQVMLAIKDKLGVIDIISNPKKLTTMISIVGSNLRTDMTVEEITKLYSLIKTVDSKKITTKVLDASVDSPLKSSINGGGAYIIIPKKGADDFSEVKEFVQTVFPEPYIIKEAAKVYVINATGKVTNTKKIVDSLTRLGYTVVGSTASPNVQVKSALSESKNDPYTMSLLKKRFAITSTSKAPATEIQADIVITVGSSYQVK